MSFRKKKDDNQRHDRILGVPLCPDPDPPIPAFLDFLAFSVLRFYLLLGGVWPFFSKDFRGFGTEKSPCIFSGFPLLVSK